MPFNPSDEERENRIRVEILVRACDELISELRAAGGPDADWQIQVLESVRQSALTESSLAA